MERSIGGKMKKEKLVAAILATVILLVMLFSAFFIAKHLDHDCRGDQCPICSILHQCMRNLEKLREGLTGVMITFLLILGFLYFKMEKDECLCRISLISQKIRLNN